MSKRCHACGLENETGVTKCRDCGRRLVPPGWGRGADLFLTFGLLVSYVGCAASLLAGLYTMVNGHAVGGVLMALLGFCYSAAMAIVFHRVQGMKCD